MNVERPIQRLRIWPICLFVAFAPGCSDEVTNNSATSVANTPLSISDDTEPDIDRVPAPIDRAGVVRWVVSEVEEATRYVLSLEQRSCVGAHITQKVPKRVLDALTLLPSLAALAPDDLASVVAGFDECVTVEQFVEAQAPGMVAFGVPADQATCVQTRLRTDVGFVGLFRLSLAQSAEAVPQPEAEQAVTEVYAACQFDPDSVVPATVAATVPPQTEPVPSLGVPPIAQPDVSMAPPLTAEP